MGTWRIRSEKLTQTAGRLIIAHSTVEGGAEVTHVDPVNVNNSGRRIEEQLQLELKSRVGRQLDKGYKRSRDEALQGSTNQLGLINPMLALPLDKVKLTQQQFVDGAFVQRKYDGHRCLITKQNGDMLAYSRKGKPIDTIPHVLEDCYQWMQDGDTLDGELYIHGRSLQNLSSLIKRQQPESAQLCYMWYDMVLSFVYERRWSIMQDLYANSKCSQIMLAPTVQVDRMAQVYEHFAQSRDAGYEGSMLRVSTAGYEDAKRSCQLIKVKERQDCEVTVLSCRPSSQGWAILRVRLDSGKEFDVSAPGSVAEKTEVRENFHRYVNRQLTIEYAMLTADGLPFHAVAMRWHEEV